MGMGDFQLGREISLSALYMTDVLVHTCTCVEKQAVRILRFMHIPWETIKVIPVQCHILILTK